MVTVTMKILSRPGRVRRFLLAGLLALGALALATSGLWRARAQSQSELPGDVLSIATVSRSSVNVSWSGVGQSFVIPLRPALSPVCDNCQDVRINYASIKISSPDTANCYTPRFDLVISIRTSRNGPDLASGYVPYLFPIKTPRWVTATFPSGVLVRTGTPLWLVVRRADNIVSGHFSNSPHLNFPSAWVLDQDYQGPPCPDVRNPPLPRYPVFWHIDTANPYPDGQLDAAPALDGDARIGFSIVQLARVLALYYDPKIYTVAYTDTLSSQRPIPPHDYGGQRLHELQGWPNPSGVANQVARSLEEQSGRVVEVQVHEVWLDRWPQQKTRAIAWYSDTVRLKQIAGWNGWGNQHNTIGHSDTYPGYPHIAAIDAARRKIDIPTGGQPDPLPQENFDYLAMFSTMVEGRTVTQWVNSGDATEIWLFGDPTSRWIESKVAKPVGDAFDVQSQNCPLPVAGLQRRAYVMGFNMAMEVGSALHSFGHRAEDMMFAAWQGPRLVSCQANTGPGLFAHFTRIWRCYGQPDPQVNFGSMGSIHKAFNAPTRAIPNRNDVNNPDLVSFRDMAPTDEQEWYNFPNFLGGANKPVENCEAWHGCGGPGLGDGDRDRFYLWWFDHVPRYAGMTNGVWNNLWAYIMDPNCFPLLRASPPPVSCPTQ
jgi:hypothetical protein